MQVGNSYKLNFLLFYWCMIRAGTYTFVYIGGPHFLCTRVEDQNFEPSKLFLLFSWESTELI